MATTVKADDVAKTAAQRMPGQIDQLQQAIQQLKRTARDDLGVAHWEGRTASNFRDVLWRDHERELDNAVEALKRLQGTVRRVVDDILRAGGNV